MFCIIFTLLTSLTVNAAYLNNATKWTNLKHWPNGMSWIFFTKWSFSSFKLHNICYEITQKDNIGTVASSSFSFLSTRKFCLHVLNCVQTKVRFTEKVHNTHTTEGHYYALPMFIKQLRELALTTGRRGLPNRAKFALKFCDPLYK